MPDDPISDTPGRSRLVFLIGAAVVASGLVAFIAQNRDDTAVNWLFLEGSWPVWAVIVVSAAAGAVLSEVLGWLIRRRR